MHRLRSCSALGRASASCGRWPRASRRARPASCLASSSGLSARPPVACFGRLRSRLACSFGRLPSVRVRPSAARPAASRRFGLLGRARRLLRFFRCGLARSRCSSAVRPRCCGGRTARLHRLRRRQRRAVARVARCGRPSTGTGAATASAGVRDVKAGRRRRGPRRASRCSGGRYGSGSARQRRRHAGRLVRQDLRRDHHDQLGLVLLRRLAPEQLAQDRDVADARNLLQRRLHLVVHQTGDGERLAVAQLELGLGAARGRARGCGSRCSAHARWRSRAC